MIVFFLRYNLIGVVVNDLISFFKVFYLDLLFLGSLKYEELF